MKCASSAEQLLRGLPQILPFVSSPAITKSPLEYRVDYDLIRVRITSAVAISIIATLGLAWICPPAARARLIRACVVLPLCVSAVVASREGSRAISSILSELDSLGHTFAQPGSYQKAIKFFRQALKIRKERLGSEHPSVATNEVKLATAASNALSQLNNLGHASKQQGNHQKALESFQQTLKIREEFQANVPDVANNLDDIGFAFRALGRHEDSLEAFQKALKLREDSLEAFEKAFRLRYKCFNIHPKNSNMVSYDPTVADSVENIGLALRALGRHEDALDYFRRGLETRRNLFGNNHLGAAKSFDYIAFTLGCLERHEEAVDAFKQATNIRKARHGDRHLKLLTHHHLNVIDSLRTVGISLLRQGKFAEALRHVQQALEIRKTLLGNEDLSVAESLHDVGVTLGCLRRHEESLEFHQQALEIRKKLLGNNHLSVADNLDDVGIALTYLGRHEKALEAFGQAQEIRKAHPREARNVRYFFESLTHCVLNSLSKKYWTTVPRPPRHREWAFLGADNDSQIYWS